MQNVVIDRPGWNGGPCFQAPKITYACDAYVGIVNTVIYP